MSKYILQYGSGFYTVLEEESGLMAEFVGPINKFEAIMQNGPYLFTS